MSERLPEGWKWVRLGEVCEFLDGMRIPVNDAERQKRILGKEQSELYPYYGANGQIGWIDGYLFDEELVLLAEDGGFFGSSEKPIAYRVSGKCWVNNHAHVLRFVNPATQQFVETYLNSISIEDFVTGAAQPKLNQQALNRIPIPIPDEKSIQQAIVAEIEAEQELVNANRELIERMEKKIQAVLARVWGERDNKKGEAQP